MFHEAQRFGEISTVKQGVSIEISQVQAVLQYFRELGEIMPLKGWQKRSLSYGGILAFQGPTSISWKSTGGTQPVIRDNYIPEGQKLSMTLNQERQVPRGSCRSVNLHYINFLIIRHYGVNQQRSTGRPQLTAKIETRISTVKQGGGEVSRALFYHLFSMVVRRIAVVVVK